jgi:hypothetical protein
MIGLRTLFPGKYEAASRFLTIQQVTRQATAETSALCRNDGTNLRLEDSRLENSTFSVAQWAGLANPSCSAQSLARIIVGRMFNG